MIFSNSILFLQYKFYIKIYAIDYMDYKFVIPSHNRVDIIKEKTLSTLERYSIPKNLIYIFVAEEL